MGIFIQHIHWNQRSGDNSQNKGVQASFTNPLDNGGGKIPPRIPRIPSDHNIIPGLCLSFVYQLFDMGIGIQLHELIGDEPKFQECVLRSETCDFRRIRRFHLTTDSICPLYAKFAGERSFFGRGFYYLFRDQQQ